MAVDFSKLKPKQHRQFLFGPHWPTSVALLAGDKLAAGDQEGRILVWDLAADPTATGPSAKPSDSGKRLAPDSQPVRMLTGHTNGIARLVASPDGRRLYSAGWDHVVKVWNLDSSTTGEAETSIEHVSDERRKPATPPVMIKVPTQAAAATLTGHDDWVSAMAVSTDGKLLITGDYAARVIVWDAASGKEIRRFSGLPWNWIVALAVSPDGRSVLVSEARGKRDDFDIPAAALRLWDIATATETVDYLKAQFPKYDRTANSYESAQAWRKFTGDSLIAAAFSPDGATVAVGQGGETDKGTAHLLDVKTGKLVRDVGSHQYGMTDLCFTTDGKHLLSTGRDTCLRITGVADGKEALQLGTPRGGQFKDWFSAVAKSADERYLAAADIAGWVHVWRAAE
jgi:WD40 repeat protein